MSTSSLFLLSCFFLGHRRVCRGIASQPRPPNSLTSSHGMNDLALSHPLLGPCCRTFHCCTHSIAESQIHTSHVLRSPDPTQSALPRGRSSLAPFGLRTLLGTTTTTLPSYRSWKCALSDRVNLDYRTASGINSGFGGSHG